MRFSELTGLLLLCMIAAQFIWLAAIWKTGATERLDKVLGTGLLTLAGSGISLALAWMGSRSASPSGAGFDLAVSPPAAILILCSLVIVGGVFYASRQRIWPFDEEGDEYAARLLAEKGFRTFWQDYADLPWLGMQHPPLIPIIGGALLRLSGFRLLVLRLVSVGFLAGTIVVTYVVGSMLYSLQVGLLGAVLLLIFPLVWRLGSAAMLDVPATFWFALTVCLALLSKTAVDPFWPTLFAGIAVGLGLWTRYSVALIYPVLLVFVWLNALTWSLLFVILTVSLMVIMPWVVLAYRSGVLARQLDQLVIYSGKKAGIVNPQKEYKGRLGQLGLTRSWRMRLRLETLVSRLPSSLGAYSLPLILLFLLPVIAQYLTADGILLAWIIVPFGLLLLMMPDHRYFLPIFPALALGIARGLDGSSLRMIPPVVLGLLLCAANLYLFTDWQRREYLFSKRGI